MIDSQKRHRLSVFFVFNVNGGGLYRLKYSLPP
jgi:hypothetical protein